MFRSQVLTVTLLWYAKGIIYSYYLGVFSHCGYGEAAVAGGVGDDGVSSLVGECWRGTCWQQCQAGVMEVFSSSS